MTSFANILKSIGANAAKEAKVGTAGSGVYNKLSNTAGSAKDSQPDSAPTESKERYNRLNSASIPPLPYLAQDNGSGNETAVENELESKFGKIAEGITDSVNKSNKPKKENNADPLSAILASAVGPAGVFMRPEQAYAEEVGNIGDETQAKAPLETSEEKNTEHYLPTMPISYAVGNPGGYTYDQWASEMESQNKFNLGGLKERFQENFSGAEPLTLQMPVPLSYVASNPEGLSYEDWAEKYKDEIPTIQIYNPLDFYGALIPAIGDTYFNPSVEDSGHSRASGSSAQTRSDKSSGPRTILDDYNDYLGTDEGKEWAKLYEEYADPEMGFARLLDSGDIDAFMQMLGDSEGWNGSTRMRARYNNSIPGLYDWRTGEFNEDAFNMAADYLWGDDSLSLPGLAAGTDNLSRILSPEDAALLAQWSNLLADKYGFGMGIAGDPYGFDARDAALYLYATAMTGDNALDFDQDITNKMLERANSNQRVGGIGSETRAALPTMEARGYAIPDIENGSLNPIFEGKSTPYYDYALLESMVASANARNNGKYGIYGI